MIRVLGRIGPIPRSNVAQHIRQLATSTIKLCISITFFHRINPTIQLPYYPHISLPALNYPKTKKKTKVLAINIFKQMGV